MGRFPLRPPSCPVGAKSRWPGCSPLGPPSLRVLCHHQHRARMRAPHRCATARAARHQGTRISLWVPRSCPGVCRASRQLQALPRRRRNSVRPLGYPPWEALRFPATVFLARKSSLAPTPSSTGASCPRHAAAGESRRRGEWIWELQAFPLEIPLPELIFPSCRSGEATGVALRLSPVFPPIPGSRSCLGGTEAGARGSCQPQKTRMF